MARLGTLARAFVLLGGWLVLWLLQGLCGYGERPLRVLWWLLGTVIGFALVYFFFAKLQPHDFRNCLYYSLVSCTALGYGGWATQFHGWVKALGAIESGIGIFLIALFVATFTRWATR